MYDLIIIGAGPAGTAAGVYAARKQLKTLLIAEEFGGQSVVSEKIYNWIGTPEVSGLDLAKSFQEHLEYYSKNGEYLELKLQEKVTKVTKLSEDKFEIEDTAGKKYEAKTILVVAGSSRRKLEVENADKYEHKGITYCASCDGPLFTDQDVVVIGGGNAGFETAAQLLAYTKSVTLLHRGPEYKADKITVDKVLSNPKMKGVLNANTKKILGTEMVTGLIYEDENGQEQMIETTGIFVEIGQIPNTNFVKEIVDFTKYNQIVVDPWTQRSSQVGIWAAGDCSNVRYHQNNIAAGDAVKAIENIYLYLHADK